MSLGYLANQENMELPRDTVSQHIPQSLSLHLHCSHLRDMCGDTEHDQNPLRTLRDSQTQMSTNTHGCPNRHMGEHTDTGTCSEMRRHTGTNTWAVHMHTHTKLLSRHVGKRETTDPDQALRHPGDTHVNHTLQRKLKAQSTIPLASGAQQRQALRETRPPTASTS